MKYIALGLVAFSVLLGNTVRADDLYKTYPAAIQKVLVSAKEKDDRSIKKIEVAGRIQKKWEDVESYSFKINKNSKVTVIAIVEFLCPHCHDFLSGIKDVDLDKEKINLYVLSLPVFGTDLSNEYGSTMSIAYNMAPDKILEILKHYAFRDIDALKKQLNTDYKIDISDSIKKGTSYDGHEKLMLDLDVPSVPMPFLLIDRLDKGKIVAPLPNYNAQEIIKIAHEAESMSDAAFLNLKEELKQ